jgi:ribosomal protein L37AE/L43A
MAGVVQSTPECPRCRSRDLIRVGQTASVTLYTCSQCKAAVAVPDPAPIRYERDDASRRVVITITGPFNESEVRACVEQHRADGAWTYGVLYDLRRMTSEPTRETLAEFAALTKPRPGETPRGPVAVITMNPRMYSLACLYAAMVGAHSTVSIFRDRDEADAWLNQSCQSAAYRPGS